MNEIQKTCNSLALLNSYTRNSKYCHWASLNAGMAVSFTPEINNKVTFTFEGPVSASAKLPVSTHFNNEFGGFKPSVGVPSPSATFNANIITSVEIDFSSGLWKNRALYVLYLMCESLSSSNYIVSDEADLMRRALSLYLKGKDVIGVERQVGSSYGGNIKYGYKGGSLGLEYPGFGNVISLALPSKQWEWGFNTGTFLTYDVGQNEAARTSTFKHVSKYTFNDYDLNILNVNTDNKGPTNLNSFSLKTVNQYGSLSKASVIISEAEHRDDLSFIPLSKEFTTELEIADEALSLMQQKAQSGASNNQLAKFLSGNLNVDFALGVQKNTSLVDQANSLVKELADGNQANWDGDELLLKRSKEYSGFGEIEFQFLSRKFTIGRQYLEFRV